MTRILENIGWVVMMLLATLVAAIASLYFFLGPQTVAPPPLLETVLQRQTIFFLHIGGGLIALLVGAWNFLEISRQRFLNLHRWLGRIYLVCVLTSSLAGLALSFTAQGGLSSRIGFAMLAVLWLTTAIFAYIRIRGIRLPSWGVRLPSWLGGVAAASADGVVETVRAKRLDRVGDDGVVETHGVPRSYRTEGAARVGDDGVVEPDIPSHRRWMIRNYSLTFAAVTLRLWLPILMISGYNFESAYQTVAWLSWVPNLIVAEIIANTVTRRRPTESLSP